MVQGKSIFLLLMLFAVFLSSCAQGMELTQPPVPGTEIPQQVATVTPDMFTQTLEPVPSTPVLDIATVPPSSGVIKPPDSDTPAAGICGEALGDPVPIMLGTDPSGLPVAGRCIVIDPARRIKLVNQTGSPLNMNFAGYQINLPVGGEMLLDKPVGAYLALGVHFLPLGPELWVKTAVVATMPPPIVQYENSTVGYKLGLPADWYIDENGMTNSTSREVIFSPPNAEPFVAYLSISLEFRTLAQIIDLYAQHHPDAVREDAIFNGHTALKYRFPGGRHEYFVPAGDRILLIATDRPDDGVVRSILLTIQFVSSTSTTYVATIMDNGRTFTLKVGDSLRLDLDRSYDWSAVSVSDTVVLGGAQNTFQALAPGSASLSVTGDPTCLKSIPPCLAPSILFQITAVVQ